MMLVIVSMLSSARRNVLSFVALPPCVRRLVAIAVAALFLGCATPPPAVARLPIQRINPPVIPLGPVNFRGKPLEAGYVAFRFIMVGGFGSISAVLAERTVDGAAVEVETVVGRRHYKASREQWDLLVKEMEGAGFWFKPEEDVLPWPRVKDGDSWMLEGLRDGVRHRVIRHNPRIEADERGLLDFLELCQSMTVVGRIKCGEMGCLPIDYLNAPRDDGRP